MCVRADDAEKIVPSGRGYGSRPRPGREGNVVLWCSSGSEGRCCNYIKIKDIIRYTVDVVKISFMFSTFEYIHNKCV